MTKLIELQNSWQYINYKFLVDTSNIPQFNTLIAKLWDFFVYDLRIKIEGEDLKVIHVLKISRDDN